MIPRIRFVIALISRPLLLALVVLLSSSSVRSQEVAANWYSKKTAWHGFDQFHFQIAGSSAYLVTPAKALAGNPWIWRARFPGYHAEMDIELVGKGFHLAYFDVGGQFGCPDVVQRAEKFYQFLVNERGLNPKASMEGVSRGGLFVYNWTARYPERVASIYCDTPVCDFRSWPGGKGSGIGSIAAWKQCLAAYQLNEKEALEYDQMPIDHAEIIAREKIPLLHIVSENDRVVPAKENTYRLREQLRKFDHELQLISVAEGTTKSNGHHFDHPEPQRVIDFFMNNRPE